MYLCEKKRKLLVHSLQIYTHVYISNENDKFLEFKVMGIYSFSLNWNSFSLNWNCLKT